MDSITLRFPHLSEMIFAHLDNQSLSNCTFVSKSWSVNIGEQKFYGIRIIKETVKKFHKLSEPWFEVFKKANTENIMELRNCFDNFYQFYEERRQKRCIVPFRKEVTPLHLAASAGNILLYIAIHKLAKNKHPKTEDGLEPIFYAINKGHVKMAEFLIQRSVDKNPEGKNGSTALHCAAQYGRVEVCESILKHLEDKNPKSSGGLCTNRCYWLDTTSLCCLFW